MQALLLTQSEFNISLQEIFIHTKHFIETDVCINELTSTKNKTLNPQHFACVQVFIPTNHYIFSRISVLNEMNLNKKPVCPLSINWMDLDFLKHSGFILFYSLWFTA